MKKTSLYLDPEVDRALERRAALEGITKAELVRRVLADAVSERPRPRARGVFEGPKDLGGTLSLRDGFRRAVIVDLRGEAVERHSDPVEEGYRRMERAGRERSLASELLPNLTLQTSAVLG